MSGPFGSSPWGYNPGGDFYSYTIDQSLRFNDDDSAYLSRTPGSAGNRKTWTWSSWVKRANISSFQGLFASRSDLNDASYMYTAFITADNFQFASYSTVFAKTSQLFRDSSAWYHIVIAFDATAAAAADRLKIYVNGSEADLDTDNRSSIANQDYAFNQAGPHYISGRYVNSWGSGFDGYMAEINLIDGTALTAASFGETKDGVWIPKKYSGSYGTNGFYLSYKSSDLNTTGSSRTDPYGSGTDQPDDTFADNSGSGNHWTISGLVASDVVLDSPTNNFATWNPLVNTTQSLTFKEGNLNLAASSQTWAGSGDDFNQSTIGVLGGSNAKHYFEFTMENNTSGSYVIGVGRHNSKGIDTTHYTGGVVFYNTRCSSDSTDTVTGITRVTSLTIVRLAFDASNGKVWIGDNNGYFNSGDPANGTGEVGTISGYDGETLVAILNRSTNSGNQIVNFGQDSTFANRKTSGSANAADGNGIGDFYYTPPSGFLALCTSNLSEPEIIDGTDNFNTVLWTGNGASSRAISGVGFSPDFVWAKQRPQAISHVLYDSVRGAGNDKELSSNSGAVEGGGNSDQYGYLSSFDSDGFTGSDGTGSPNYYFNENSRTFVAWNWLAGTAFSNDAGANGASIASSGQVNTKAGFSIVSYTGSGSNATVAHGLGVAPSMVIIKSRVDTTGDGNWLVYAKAGTVDETDYLLLNGAAKAEDEAGAFNDTAATATTFSLGTFVDLNQSSITYIAYCFANIEGYCKVGTYLGNNSADGTFVYTGFRPAWVMIKKYNVAGQWWGIYDSARDPDNLVTQRLWANEDALESAYSTDELDFVSNGFKPRGNYDSINGSGSSYLYLAFAENPFKYANAR